MPFYRSIATLTTCVVAGLTPAHAQQAAPAATPAVDVPALTCESPGSPPIDRTGPAMSRFAKRVDEYKLCINQYAAATGGKGNEFAAQARAYTDAANKAIDDYNAYITGLNEATKSSQAAGVRK